jgi:hypothetical protein
MFDLLLAELLTKDYFYFEFAVIASASSKLPVIMHLCILYFSE